MKIIKKISIAVLLVWAISNTAHAATFSQTNVSLSAGQSTTVYAYNASASLYISNNTNSNIATATINGSTVLIYGNNNGSTSVTVCENTTYVSTYNCTPIYITVNGYNNGNTGSLSLSQTNVSLSVGQTSTITASNYNYYNTYTSLYVSSNSNPSVATASVTNNNTISIYANTAGSTTLTVCQSNGSSSCSSVYVTVSGGYNYSSNSLGFILSNLILSIGDSLTLTSANPGSSGLSVLSNSNPNVVLVSPSWVTPGCVGSAYYNTITGQPCVYATSTQYSTPSYVAGCTAGALYNIYTGQPCYGGGYNSQSSSLTLSPISLGQSTVTVCQTNAICSAITVSVTR